MVLMLATKPIKLAQNENFLKTKHDLRFELVLEIRWHKVRMDHGVK